MSKLQANAAQDREALVHRNGEVKTIWISEGYEHDGDRDAGLITLYRLGDTVRGGIGQGWTIIGWPERS